MKIQKRISIWGATGSIGTQTLDVVGQHKDKFEIETLTTHFNAAQVLEQAKQLASISWQSGLTPRLSSMSAVEKEEMR